MNPALVLFAALFTGVSAVSAGLIALQCFRVRLHRAELVPIAFLLGSALLSTAVFLSAATFLARPWFFAALGSGLIATAAYLRAWPVDRNAWIAKLPVWWKLLFAAGLTAYGVFSFAHAMAPEMSPDGTAYHLGTVDRYLRQAGFEWYTNNMYANMPMGVEMLFLFAYSFGRHSSAALVHWQFYLLIPLLMLQLGRRVGMPVAGALAGLLVFAAPVAGIDGASAYVDMATAAVVFGLFYVLVLFEKGGSRGLLVVAGLLAGWAYSCKMTAFPATPFALGYVAFVLWRRRESWLKPVLLVGSLAAAMIAPWMIKNALMVGNPVSPFLNRWFPNPYVRINFEDEYRELHRTYYGRVTSAAQIPLEITVRGGNLNGLLGPVFLMAPIALLALRWPLGRRALVAALVFASTYPGNIGTRFLLTSLPFLAFSMGLVLERARGMPSAAALFHLWMSWPGIIPAYADPYSWRLDTFRWKQALRIERDHDFLDRLSPGYSMAHLVEQHVPEHGRVLTFGGVAEAYTSREILVAYQSGFNNLAGEILAAGMGTDMHPTRGYVFRLPSPVLTDRVRIVQTEHVPDTWSVSEIRLHGPGGQELPRTHLWRLKAWPNPWDVRFAFDNCPITRWRNWEPARPGHWIEVGLGHIATIGGARVEASPDQRTSVALEYQEKESERWIRAELAPEMIEQPPLTNARAIASDDLKRLGISYLVIGNEDFIANDLFRNRKLWGVTLVGEAGGARLYRID